MNLRKLVPATLAAAGLAASVGFSSQANAYAYAHADAWVKDFTVTVLPVGSTALTDFAACAL